MPTNLQTRSLPGKATNWVDSLTFDQIDPASYNAATLTVTGTLSAAAFVESSEADASTFTDVDTGALTVAGVTASPVVTLTAALGAADGTFDYAGAAGRVLTGSASAEGSLYLVDNGSSAGLQVFGDGTFTVPAYATASVTATGPGNFAATFQSSIAASATLEASGTGNPGGFGGGVVDTPSPPVHAGFSWSGVSRITQTFNIGPSITGWSSALAVAGFDPELGRLVGVDVGVAVSGSGSYDAINLDPEASNFQLTQNAAVNVAAASGAVLDGASAGARSTALLGSYAPGSAGTSNAYALTPSSQTTTLTDAGSLAPFVGAGAVSLTASSTGATTLTGPGNLAFSAALAAGATITVTYDYNPVTDPMFDRGYYLAQNPDVAASGIDPYQHFLAFGWKEGRDPSLMFSDSKYLAANPDVAAAGVDPLAHYSAFGLSEGRAAFLSGGTAAADPLVNAAFYDAQLGATLIPAGAAGAQQAAWSYDNGGWQKGLNPDALFDTRYYLAHNPDVAAAGIDPLLHYETSGWKEGRDPSAQFSTNQYLAAYGDVRAANMDPLLHYVVFGQAEGRTAFHA